MSYFDFDIQIYTFDSIKVYISPSPTIQSIDFFIDYLHKEGIDHVTDLCNSKENEICTKLKSVDTIKFRRLKIDDGSHPSEKQLHKLDKNLDKLDFGAKILLYCRAGLGRAPTVLAYIMISRFNYDYVDAIQEIRSKKKGSLNMIQIKWIIDQQKKNKNKCTVL